MSSTPDIPQGIPADNDYVSRSGHKQEPIPVQSDGATIEDPIDADSANSDAQLGRFCRYDAESGLTWLYRA